MRLFCLVACLVPLSSRLAAAPVAVPPAAADAWRRALLPLPHELALTQKLLLTPDEISLKARPGAGEIETQALTELQELFKTKAGRVPACGAFRIVLGTVDADGVLDGVKVEAAARLKTLSHPEQAYVIMPLGADGLAVAALNERGVYHGTQTLIQLLGARLSAERVEVPLVTITDWPDLDERGLWNNDLKMIPWLASLKINFAIDPVNFARFEKGKPVTTNMRVDALAQARPRAVQFLPHLPHYNFLHRYGLNEVYPELVGKGERAKCPYTFATQGHRAPCASNPLLRQLTAEGMADCAAKGAREVAVWGSEHLSQCECEACLKLGQFRTETNAAVGAWQDVCQKYPNLGLRIFYCMGGKSREDTQDCLLSLPPEVKIEWCYGEFRPAFDAAAAQGRWLGNYSTGPMFYPGSAWLRFWATSIRADIKSQYDRKWSAKYAITHYSPVIQDAHNYNISALAEYEWNLTGRDLRELGWAWAVRQGCERPEQVAEWIALMDPIESALIEGALHNFSRDWEAVPELLSQRKTFGGNCIFAGFPTAASFAEKLATCQQALTVAAATNRQDLVLETQYVTALIDAVRSVHALLDQGAPTTDPKAAAARVPAPADVQAFRTAVETMIRVMNERTHLEVADRAAHAAVWQKRVAAISAAAERMK